MTTAAVPLSETQESMEIQLMDLLSYAYLLNGLPNKASVLMAARNVLRPDDARALLVLAVAQVRSSKAQSALDTLDRLALLGAMDATFHLVRAQALQALERREDAASAIRAYVAMRPLTSANTSGVNALRAISSAELDVTA